MKFKVIFVIFALLLYTSFLPIFNMDAEAYSPIEDFERTRECAQTGLSVSAHAAALLSDNGEVLFQKNGDVRLGIASTTKIMTAIVALETSSLDDEVVIPKEAVGIEGSSLYLKHGEILTVEELLYGLLLQSGNDAALALAIHIAGSVEGFVSIMNAKADSLGLIDTHFTNPHGLDDDEHYSTAVELGKITAYALKNEVFRKISSTYTHKIRLDGNEGGRLLVNHNKLLKIYEGAIGVKTGFTKSTGRTLVGAAERDGLTLISVTLNDGDDWRDHAKMLDLGFSEYRRYEVAKAGEINLSVPINFGERSSCLITNDEIPPFTVKKGSVLETRFIIPDSVNAPIVKGMCLGEIEFYCDGIMLGKEVLYAVEDIDRKRLSFWERLKNERNKNTESDQRCGTLLSS